MSSWTAPPNEIVSVLQTRTGRPLRVFQCALEIIRVNLIPTLDALGLIPEARRQQVYPKAFHFFGEDLGKVDNPLNWPRIIVGGATTQSELGMGWQNEVQVNIACAWPGPAIGRRQFEESFDLATIVGGIFRHPQFSPFQDPADPTRTVWNAVLPGGESVIPTSFREYSGWLAHLTIRQPPGGNLW